MKFPRLVEGGAGAFLSKSGLVYFLTGVLDEFESERYRTGRDMWELVPNFREASNNESLNFYFGALINDNKNFK